MEFQLISDYKPTGDQPEAIKQLVANVVAGVPNSTLFGVTGSGKTFTMANVISQLNRPTLVLSHNKTLAAQLYAEFKSFFPNNAVEYFVSYYDYYQPEAYIPATDTYIEKDLSINKEIDRMRLSATHALLSGRRDVIVVASVSCIYGIGNPQDSANNTITLNVGDSVSLRILMCRLVELLYTRVKGDLEPATFRVTGDTIIVAPATGEIAYRISFFGKTIEAIDMVNCSTGEYLGALDSVNILPTNIFIPNKTRIKEAVEEIKQDLDAQIEHFERCGREMEAARIKQRVEYDLEMIQELGYCSGIENYSRYFDKRLPGQRPFCLLDYFPQDMLLFIDESHVTVPQLRGMFGGDKARKDNLVEYGFRLPAARDNRPLRFEEFELMQGKTIYVSATPSSYELNRCENSVVELFIRPTGLVDPPLSIHNSDNQIDLLLEEIEDCRKHNERAIVTTITKRMAEELSSYLSKIDIATRYIHSDITTLDRVKILNDFRNGEFDVLVGVNLLREGIDLPEVAKVIIIDADKEGFLRNKRALIQMAGRAARNTQGRVILYAATVTDSLKGAIGECNARCVRQVLYNIEHKIMPGGIKRQISITEPFGTESAQQEETTIQREVIYSINDNEDIPLAADSKATYRTSQAGLYTRLEDIDKDIERAIQELDFKRAISLRDQRNKLLELLNGFNE